MLLRSGMGYVLWQRLYVSGNDRRVSVLGQLLMIKKPTEHTVTRGVSVLGIIAAVTAVGALIATWQKIIPYVTALELESATRAIYQELEDEKEDRCDNTIARLANWIHMANVNKWNAEHRTPPDREYALSQERAITGFKHDMLVEKRECGFR